MGRRRSTSAPTSGPRPGPAASIPAPSPSPAPPHSPTKVGMDNHDHEAVILSAVRTPMGRYQGGLSALSATRLGAVVVAAAVERAGVDPLRIDEVLMGNVVSAGACP